MNPAVPEDRATLRFTRRYTASRAEVWAALTDPDSRSRWPAAPPDVTAGMRTIEPGAVFELDWRRTGEADSIVRVELISDEAGNVLVLEHARLEAHVCMRYFGFWEPRLDEFAQAIGGERK